MTFRTEHVRVCGNVLYCIAVLAVTLALHCVPSSAFSPGAIATLRPSVQSSCSGRGHRKNSVTTLKAEAGTEKKKFRGPGNPAAAALQTSTFGIFFGGGVTCAA